MPLTEPVPDTWVTKEGNFHLVSAVLMPMLSVPEFRIMADPCFPLEVGSMRLTWTCESFSRSAATKMIIGVGIPRIAGTVHSSFTRVNVKAFRLEPETAPGNMTVDGEQVPYGPIQGQVHQGLLHVMSRRRKK